MKLYDAEETMIDGSTRKYINLELSFEELDIIDTALADYLFAIARRAAPTADDRVNKAIYREKVEALRSPIFKRVTQAARK